ncbi:MAG: hypothetical protein K0S76_453 [Herbinix sp.]|jgi:hypothetical protein|nr:hypothetical protein [Herbinix sp.]
MKVKLFFRWFDLWIGIYIDRSRKTAYICPIPMFGVKIDLWELLTPHYQIIGKYTKKPIGCCRGKEGLENAKLEEPGATFKKISRKKCNICNHD